MILGSVFAGADVSAIRVDSSAIERFSAANLSRSAKLKKSKDDPIIITEVA
jgi:hypothetical protein